MLLTTFPRVSMRNKQVSQQSRPSSTTMPPPTSISEGQHITPQDLGFTKEEWSARFRLPTQEEWGEDSVSLSDIEVKVISTLPAPTAGRAVEGVFESDPFAAAHARNLHGAPQVSQSSRGKVAWVVFTGREPGVYQTWSVHCFT